jgi:hypothetical protein
VRNGSGYVADKASHSCTVVFFLHAVNLRHGTDSFTSPLKEVWIFITHKNPPSSAGPEPTSASLLGPIAGTLTTRPLRVALTVYSVLQLRV